MPEQVDLLGYQKEFVKHFIAADSQDVAYGATARITHGKADDMTACDKSQEQPLQYVGVVDGVTYRMDARANGAWTFRRIDPQDLPTPPFPKHPPKTAAKDCPGALRKIPLSVEAAPRGITAIAGHADQRDLSDPAEPKVEASAVKPFPRDGAEPLRVGHPDLWNLLVAGTCLEGCPCDVK